MFVLEFLTKDEIEKIFDKDSKLVIGYLLKKVLFSQPELLPEESSRNIQMTKEFLENWVAQALGWEIIGAGNYPIDVYSKKDKIGADVKFLSAKTNNDGSFSNGISNETSLSQKFISTGENLDQLFKQRKKKAILDGWIDILVKKNNTPITDYGLNHIYYFIFIRGGSSINLAIAKVNEKLIPELKISKFTSTSAFISGYIDDKYGNVKIYKSKKRIELRCNPKKLENDELLIKWDFSENIQHQKPVKLREIIGDQDNFKKYISLQIKKFFDL
ncbi:hypothetical protein D4R87_01280 [bacterium]|nr:MAG: hypothetical protein D4R87_01280 [bacterium]